ncbi:threonine transporter (plasmid) [Ahniella affigens]|uniref:Threonine transporter n=2 Tax=Ahniella affigens TaxID=2021234 RepID=A0A2P1PZR0_9GAMM|nr:threonine transporter [Ahniella affigens]
MPSPQVKNPFNSPLETGVRALTILVEAHPAEYDLQRLVELDYLVVHSGDAGGPASLHAPLPLRAGELLVRRGLIEKGLALMMSRGLIRRNLTGEGFRYYADDSAGPFISALTTRYARQLRARANWAVNRFDGVPTDDIRRITHRLFERWSSEFQTTKLPGGTA